MKTSTTGGALLRVRYNRSSVRECNDQPCRIHSRKLRRSSCKKENAVGPARLYKRAIAEGSPGVALIDKTYVIGNGERCPGCAFNVRL